MRGKRSPGAPDRHHRRIIPAHAGQTPPESLGFGGFPDHPRACGANSVQPYPIAPSCGSSPRMRGKPCGLRTLGKSSRIIPAHAGQTIARPYRRHSSADHPRTCGANQLPGEASLTLAGSSPHMRGKQPGERRPGRFRRIIPAHAGQTNRRCP